MAPPAPAPPPATGRLTDYELQYIDKGSFGAVFKAVRKSDGRVYALKQVDLRSADFKNPTLDRAAAIDEARMLAQLNHPHVIRHFESFVDGEGKLNILMEYASKGSVRQLVKSYRGRPLPEEGVWRIFIQTLIGLSYLHSKKVGGAGPRRRVATHTVLHTVLQTVLGDCGAYSVILGGALHLVAALCIAGLQHEGSVLGLPDKRCRHQHTASRLVLFSHNPPDVDHPPRHQKRQLIYRCVRQHQNWRLRHRALAGRLVQPGADHPWHALLHGARCALLPESTPGLLAPYNAVLDL